MWDRIVARTPQPIRLLGKAARSYGQDRAGRMAAAVAYRAIFALAPLLILSVAVFGLVAGGSEAARQDLFDLIERVAGPRVAEAVDLLAVSAVESGDAGLVVGLLLFAWTGSSLFIEVQDDLNDIFRVPFEETAGLAGALRKRLLGVVWASCLGLTLVPIWLVNLGGDWFETLLPPELEVAHTLLGWGSRLLSLAVLPALFALAVRTLTRATIRWRAILSGGLFTTVAFLLTSYGAGLYFAFDAETPAPQIAGAFFVVLLLAYLLSAVFLFGAVITRLHNDHLAVVEG